MSKDMYTVVVDDGKPFEEKVSRTGLRAYLLRLKKRFLKHQDDYPYFDVKVYDPSGKDVTDKIHRELKINE